MVDVLVIEGSRTDDENTNKFLKVLQACNVRYRVDCASAHWHAGQDYADYVDKIAEGIVVFIGGMSLVAPGLISATLRNLGKHNRLVFAVPTDEAARSAIEDLSVGTPLLTSGLNTVSLRHGIQNSALAVAKLALAIYRRNEIDQGINDFLADMKKEKSLKSIELDEKGLIPGKISPEG